MIYGQMAEADLQAEFTDLLRDLEPDESPFAAQFLDDWDTGKSQEKAFGIPAGGMEILIGNLLAPFLIAIAREILEKVKDKAVEEGAEAGLEWIKSRFKGKTLPKADSRAETVGDIVTALIKAGWSPSEAGRAAEKVWESGEKAARKLAGRKSPAKHR